MIYCQGLVTLLAEFLRSLLDNSLSHQHLITNRCSGNEPMLNPEESLLGEESQIRGSGGNQA